MTINLISTQHSVHHSQIEWNVLSQIISQFAYFESNKKNLVSRIFSHQLEELTLELAHTELYLKIFKDEYRQVVCQLLSRLPSDSSLHKYILHLSKEGFLNFAELNKVTLLLETVIFLKQDLPDFKIPEFETLKSLDFQTLQRKFLREFRHLVDEDGEVHFERHPELAELNRRLRELEERIRKSVQEWINQPQNQKILQYNSYDVHYDRFVVPVRSDSYRSDIGLIVSRSDSGQTLFVEPFEVREHCNRRLELIAKIDEIINKLALKFSHDLHTFSPLSIASYDFVQTMDFYLAKSQFAQDHRLECPRLRETPGFSFSQLFHPLIKNPVKNSADCSKEHFGIVISGPNTGGKTVFLKSIALSYMLLYHGFFVPASEAEMYPYEGLFYFGNDLQDLQTGLSSFSGEVKNYISLIENILPTNLILIDEIFNSTSSDEASALSIAYFDELHRKAGCHIIVSTHHQMFKTLVHQNKNYISAHVGFDTKEMRPTYKVQWGTPGSSMAIDIFRILSRNHPEVKNVPEKALSQMSQKNVSYETLLQKVSQKQIELDQLLNSNRKLESDLKNQKGAMEGVLNLRLKDELSRAKNEVDKILNEARNLVEEARRQEITKTRKVDERSHQLKNQISRLAGDVPEIEASPQIGNLDINLVKPGDTVYSVTLKKDFTVVSMDLRKNEVIIGKGPIKFTVPADSLSHTKKAPLRSDVKVSFEMNNDAQIEIDARGMRLSEFQNIVERTLGDLLRGDIPYLNVIHGHGEGTLKNWLRQYLRTSKDFIAAPLESGNDGETKILLKG
jgi:DNA mismatch repair protein MutS2